MKRVGGSKMHASALWYCSLLLLFFFLLFPLQKKRTSLRTNQGEINSPSSHKALDSSIPPPKSHLPTAMSSYPHIPIHQRTDPCTTWCLWLKSRSEYALESFVSTYVLIVYLKKCLCKLVFSSCDSKKSSHLTNSWGQNSSIKSNLCLSKLELHHHHYGWRGGELMKSQN